jgi:molybdopterin-guanine dinucleotide biosynthesis protein A
MPLFPNVEAFLLVGGKSSRMGRDKALLEINGAPLVRRAADILTPLASKITLVTSAPLPAEPTDTNRYSSFGLPVQIDRWPNAGPLGGIATALAAAQNPWCLILACDMPFITREWLIFLLGHSIQSDSEIAASHIHGEFLQQTDVIIPETERGLEPLCAIYRASCAPILAAALENGVRKVTDAVARLNQRRITENEWRVFSPDGNLFGNLNTWQDYLEAQQRIKS